MPVNSRSGKRRLSDTPPQYAQDVPSFLENSPFFLPANGDFEPVRRRPQPRPSVRQFVRSRRALSLVLIAVALTTFLLLSWNRAGERVSRNLGRLGLLPGGGTRCLYDASRQAVVPSDSNPGTAIDWEANAYATYVTAAEYLCNAVMIFESLARMESKAARLLLYPNTDEFSLLNGLGNEENRRLLVKARDEYGVNLVPIKVLHKKLNYHLWQDSYTKLLVFNQTQYTRVLFLDSDATVLSPMDELFLLPPCKAAMSRAYWLKKPILTSHIMLIQPSPREFARVEKAVKKADLGTYDMEIMNRLYGSDCVVLPHRRYALLTGEFRNQDHDAYLGVGRGHEWDPQKILSEAKLIHFSDHPMPKPWQHTTMDDVKENQPRCEEDGGCRSREVWLGVYRDFRARREAICGLETP